MKPDWDKLSTEYAGHPSVLIGDVDCTTDGGKPVCEEYEVRGYPTIKYFTAETGEKGDAYQGARSLSALQDFVKDKLESKCLVDEPEGCDEKEVAYIAKMKAKDAAAIAKEITRLEGIASTGKMAPDKKVWMVKRVAILKQL
jgi:hypothetical protein